MKKKFPKSIKKFIRKEKTRIRREVFDLNEQKKLIDELYQKLASEKHPLSVTASKNAGGSRNVHPVRKSSISNGADAPMQTKK